MILLYDEILAHYIGENLLLSDGALELLGDAVGKIKVNLLDGMMDKGVVRVGKKKQSILSTDYVLTT